MRQDVHHEYLASLGWQNMAVRALSEDLYQSKVDKWNAWFVLLQETLHKHLYMYSTVDSVSLQFVHHSYPMVHGPVHLVLQ